LDTASTFDEQKWQADRDQDSPEALVRYYLARPTIRGGEVTAYNAVAPSKAQLLRSVEADEWIWNTTIATGWRSLGEHINVLEARALLLAIRWRARSPWFHHQRFLHLIDSRVVLSTVSKGRSSSYNLRRVLSKINAYCLAAHLWPKLAYVASELNPADTPSRAKREVKKHHFKTRRGGKQAGHYEPRMESPRHSGAQPGENQELPWEHVLARRVFPSTEPALALEQALPTWWRSER
jgi:hypothetical protein